jgi:hypothetical protein
VLLQSILVSPNQLDGVAILASELNDVQRQLWQCSQHDLFSLDFFSQAGAPAQSVSTEKNQPGLPVWRLGANGSLGQGEVIGFFVLLNHAFQRAAGSIGMTRLEQQQGDQNAAEPVSKTNNTPIYTHLKRHQRQLLTIYPQTAETQPAKFPPTPETPE